MISDLLQNNFFQALVEIEMKGDFIEPIGGLCAIGAVPLSPMSRGEKALYTFWRRRLDELDVIEYRFQHERLSFSQAEELNVNYLKYKEEANAAADLLWVFIHNRLKNRSRSLVLTKGFMIANQRLQAEPERIFLSAAGHG